VEALRQELAQHPGKLARDRWDELRRSTNVFARNVGELRGLLVVAETNEQIAVELIQNMHAPTVRDEYTAQLDQKLHNMIAASVSLVDHTRRLLKCYSDTEFSADFEARNDVVRHAPVAAFLRRLRNYLLHYGMAPFSYSLRVHDGAGMDSRVTLNSAALLEYSDWGSARAYIVASGQEIHLSVAVDQYSAAMRDLYNWVFAQFEGLHGDHTDAANELVRQINLTMTGGLHDFRDGWPFDVQAALDDFRRRQQGDGRRVTLDVAGEDGAPAPPADRPQTASAP